MSYSSILKWAAGAEIYINPNLKYDAKTLLNLIELHNLSGRFLKRLRFEKNGCATPQLMHGLKKLYADTQKIVGRNVMALNELQEMLPEQQVIVIKGISTYLLSDQKEVMRGGDIDILSNDPSNVIQTLIRLSYILTKAPFMHEIGEYSKNGVEFDIHEYFPVYSYSLQLRKANITSSSKSGIRIQNYYFTSRRITFSDLKRDAHHGKKVPLDKIVVTDPNLLAIIICAHSFMNYTNMWSISHRKKVCLRLSEIADIFVLSKHPDFDVKKFLEYVQQYNAQDCVEWVASVSASLFGKNPLPVPVKLKKGDTIPPERFPRCLWWNFWIGFPSRPDDLLFTDWMSIDRIIDHTDANSVIWNNIKKSSGWYSPIPQSNSLLLKHYFSMGKRPIQVSLNFRYTKRSFVIEIQMKKTAKISIDRMRIDFGKYAMEWEFDNIERKVKTTGDKEVTSLCKQILSCHKVVFRINNRNLELDNQHKNYVPVLIGVAKHDMKGRIITSNLFPMKVIQPKIINKVKSKKENKYE